MTKLYKTAERGKNDIILNFKTKIEKKGYPIIDLYQEIKKIYFIEQGGISIFKNGQQIKELNEENEVLRV